MFIRYILHDTGPFYNCFVTDNRPQGLGNMFQWPAFVASHWLCFFGTEMVHATASLAPQAYADHMTVDG